MPSSLASSALRSMTHGTAWQAEKTGSDQAAMARGLYSDLMVTVAGSIAQQLAGDPDDTDEDAPFPDFENIGSCAVMLARIEAGLR
jgi:hypothetical protein